MIRISIILSRILNNLIKKEIFKSDKKIKIINNNESYYFSTTTKGRIRKYDLNKDERSYISFREFLNYLNINSEKEKKRMVYLFNREYRRKDEKEIVLISQRVDYCIKKKNYINIKNLKSYRYLINKNRMVVYNEEKRRWVIQKADAYWVCQRHKMQKIKEKIKNIGVEDIFKYEVELTENRIAIGTSKESIKVFENEERKITKIKL